MEWLEKASRQKEQPRKRPFLGIHFKCCNTYSRIYRNTEGTAYEGCCPRCSRAVVVPIGEGGTTGRFFTAE